MSVSPMNLGAKADGTDDHVALQKAIDKASASFNTWVDGGFRSYSVTQPLVLRPSSRLRSLQIKAKPGYAPADPNNAMLMTSQGFKREFTSAAGVISTVEVNGIPEDNIGVVFKGALPTPLVAGRLYYARERTANTFKVAEQKGGTTLDVETGSGTVYCEVLSLHKALLSDVSLDGQQLPGVNGLYANLQQASVMHNLRIDNCAVGYRLEGQQCIHHNFEAISNKKALVLSQSAFMWFYGTNIEHSETGIELSNAQCCSFWGLHMETNAKHIHFPPDAGARGIVFDTVHADLNGHIHCDSNQTSYEIRNYAPYGGDYPDPVVVDTARGYTLTLADWGDTSFWESSFVQIRGNHPPIKTVRP